MTSEPDRDRITVSRSLGEVCRLRWPALHLDLHFHFIVPLRSPATPHKVVATINVRSFRDYIASWAELEVEADGHIQRFRTETLGVFETGSARLALVVAFPPDKLLHLALAKRLHFRLEGLCIPLGENSKAAIRQLIAYDAYDKRTHATDA